MTDPAPSPSPSAGQPPVPVRPMPRLGHGLVWSDIVAKIEADRPTPTPSLGATGSSLGGAMHTCADHCQCDEARCSSCADSGHVCENHPDRPWDGISDDINACHCGGAGMPCPECCDPIPEDGTTSIGAAFTPRKFLPPPAVELRAMAYDLNAHGGPDERFVAGLLQAVAGGSETGGNDAPVTYEDLVDLFARLPQPLPFATVKLTQAQIDAFPASRYAAPSDEPWQFFGTPVELVEHVEDSTPYQLVNAQSGGLVEFHWDLTDAEYERLRAEWIAKYSSGTLVARIAPFDRVLADVEVVTPPPSRRARWLRALDRVRRPR